MRVSPIAYGHIVSSLMSLAGGKVAVLLEGGYFIESMAESAAMTLRALLGIESIRIGRLPGPSPSAVDSVLNTISALRPHWNYLQIQGCLLTCGVTYFIVRCHCQRHGICHEVIT